MTKADTSDVMMARRYAADDALGWIRAAVENLNRARLKRPPDLTRVPGVPKGYDDREPCMGHALADLCEAVSVLEVYREGTFDAREAALTAREDSPEHGG